MAVTKKGKLKNRNKNITPEEQIARSFRMRCRFRAAVRFVMQNTFWLQDTDDYVLGDNVQKNIMVLTRKKSQKGLTLHIKSIMNTPANQRSEEDKILLDRAIGGLKCFRKYPDLVKSALAGVTYFVYYGPNRCIIRQGHAAIAHLFFIITGEVTFSQEIYDPLLDEMVTHVVGTRGPGSMFGELSILHDIPRTVSVITNTHCELLCLNKSDFDIVLKITVQKEWDEIIREMQRFSYFQDWDLGIIHECCMLSKMKSFDAEQIVLGDGFGVPDKVYFLLHGTCRIIQDLLVKSSIVCGKKHYTLYEPPLQRELSIKTSINVLKPSLSVETTTTASSYLTEKRSQAKLSPFSGTNNEFLPINLPQKRKRKFSVDNLPSDVELHFVQVATLKPLSCFGVGENLDHKRIMAATPTKFLMIPRFWLTTKATGNLWRRTQQYLDSHIPNTKRCFEQYINDKKWLVYRKNVFMEALSKKKKITHVGAASDAPYFFRIFDSVDFE